jgi:alpha-L-fucosidase
MQWWQDARFGMFIHWGLYALPARHEWVQNYEEISTEKYQTYFKHFEPDLYDPVAWAQAARNAGMKYLVITTKHHEGFCLWDSTCTDFKVTNTPWGKDLIDPLVDACRNEGLKVGFYYSLLDWHHPHFTIDRHHPLRNHPQRHELNASRDMAIYRQYMRDQLTELLTRYGTIDCLWLDYSYPEGSDGKGRQDWGSKDLLALVRSLQPGIIINDRLDLLDVPGGWDFRSPEQFKPQHWPQMDGHRVLWETCQTFSGSWGYHRDETTWKSATQLLTLLIETVSKGGNLLLNVGPTARGCFDARALSRLNELGTWMHWNGRAIYSCTAAPSHFTAPQNSLLTFNPRTNRLYIHLLQWPMGKLIIPGLKGKLAYAQLLHDASEVRWTQSYGGPLVQEKLDDTALVFELPIQKPDQEIVVIECYLKDTDEKKETL